MNEQLNVLDKKGKLNVRECLWINMAYSSEYFFFYNLPFCILIIVNFFIDQNFQHIPINF